jgi:Acyl-coenzyme A:6-aminopenicillanic acid acyl-transferase
VGDVGRSEILLQRRVIAGGPADFLTVHHLELRGTQVEIGAALAAEARDHFGWHPPTAGDPVRNRARRKWFERNWPEHHARMAGVAKAFELDIDDDALDFANVMAEPFNGNCSGVWCSSLLGADGHARLGRNLDFSTRTLSEMLGAPPEPEEPPVLSRPFVIETYPDVGYAAIVCTVGDLTSCLDGINEKGLAVGVLADDESRSLRPSLAPQAGVNEMHIMRYILDTCATAGEAKEVLYGTKQYDEYAVAHYLIADQEEAFVWERDTHNGEHAVPTDTGMLCVTNHLLFKNGVASVPEDTSDNEGANDAYRRGRILNDGLNGSLMARDRLWDLLESARADRRRDEANPDGRVRTLWHAQYDLTFRSVEYEFYLGDKLDGSPVRSPLVTLTFSA